MESSQIRLRAWDKKKNDWFDEDSGDLYIELNGNINFGWNGEVMDDYTDRIILMQYTGFEDIDDVKIYEGDILKWVDFEMNRTTINPVYLEGTTPIFNVCVDELIYATTLLTLNEIEYGYFEVIGNIYKNKELLEG